MVSLEGVGGDWKGEHPSCYSWEVREEGGVSPADRGVRNPKLYPQWNFMSYTVMYISKERMRDFPGDPVIASAGGQVPYRAQELDPTCCNYDMAQPNRLCVCVCVCVCVNMISHV